MGFGVVVAGEGLPSRSWQGRADQEQLTILCRCCHISCCAWLQSMQPLHLLFCCVNITGIPALVCVATGGGSPPAGGQGRHLVPARWESQTAAVVTVGMYVRVHARLACAAARLFVLRFSHEPLLPHRPGTCLQCTESQRRAGTRLAPAPSTRSARRRSSSCS